MSTRKNIIIAVLASLLMVNMVATGGIYFELSQTKEEVNGLQEENKRLSEYFIRDSESNTVNETVFSTSDVSEVRLSGPIEGDLLAYESGGIGETIPFTYQPLPTSKIYIDASEAIAGGEFQESLRVAQGAAEETKYDPLGEGYAVSLNTPDDWEYFKGGSAGLPLAAYIAATDPDYKMREGVVFTGQVDEQGSVLSVQKIEEKAKAANEKGYNVIITPHHSEDISVDGIRIIQVQSVEEALDYALIEENGG